MMGAPLYVVDIIGQVVAATAVALKAQPDSWLSQNGKDILYQYGRSVQILTILQQKNDSIDQKNTKYPLFALFQDFPEMRGGTEYECIVRFPKMVIATLASPTDNPAKRYTETFKPILYPIYLEFLNQLAKSRYTVVNDPATIVHTKIDRPGTQRAADKTMSANFNDYLDIIEIQNLQMTFSQINSC